MTDNYVFRKRAAVLCVNVVPPDIAALDDDEDRAKLLAKRHKTLTKNVTKHHGRIVRVRGGEILAVFVDAVNAVECAIEFQKHAIAYNVGAVAAKHLQFRLGVGLGDIAVDADNITGEAVEYATTLQNVTPADGVWVSGDIPVELRGRMRVVFAEVEEFVAADPQVTNFIAPIRAYAIELDKQAPMRASDYLLPDGRGGIITLIAPISGMLLLVVISIFWFID